MSRYADLIKRLQDAYEYAMSRAKFVSNTGRPEFDNDFGRTATRHADSITAIETLKTENSQLQEALIMMVDDYCEYMKTNLLGDPEKQHVIKISRRALYNVNNKGT